MRAGGLRSNRRWEVGFAWAGVLVDCPLEDTDRVDLG